MSTQHRNVQIRKELRCALNGDRIVQDPDIMFGKPTIRGTRITVELILQKLAKGMSAKEIIGHHSHLSLEDISAALEFAANEGPPNAA